MSAVLPSSSFSMARSPFSLPNGNKSLTVRQRAKGARTRSIRMVKYGMFPEKSDIKIFKNVKA
jgi:hypothetical protein